MKKQLILTGALVALALPAMADYIYYPIKYSQQPITFMLDNVRTFLGRDIPSDANNGRWMADDWFCNDPGEVVAVRWWGSYLNNKTTVRANTVGYTLPFEIGFYTSDIGSSDPNRLPDQAAGPIWQDVLAQQEWRGVDQYGENVYRYNAYLPQGFKQVAQQQYWVSIAYNAGDGEEWGWHEKGVGSVTGSKATIWQSGFWEHYTDAYNLEQISDMNFELMVIPEPGVYQLFAGLIGGIAFTGLQIYRRSKKQTK